MPMLSVYVDDATLARLARASEEMGRAVEDLATSAVAEEALRYEREQRLPGRHGPRLCYLKALLSTPKPLPPNCVSPDKCKRWCGLC
jgi:hypothetical protein